MNSLIAQGNNVAPLKRKRSTMGGPSRQTGGRPSTSSSTASKPNAKSASSSQNAKPENDATLLSISSSVRSSKNGRASKSNSNKHVPDLKLRAHLNSLDTHAKESRALAKEANELLLDSSAPDAGFVMVDDEGGMEKTWRVDQDDIVKSVGEAAAGMRREWALDGGPYRCRYTRNGRHMLIGGRNGHVASFDWQGGKMHFELQLRESIRDITYLFDQSHVAVAQKQHVFIYDQDGVELHRLNAHIDCTRLEFLPYHWLLASIGNSGFLKYTDTSTGTMVSEQRTKLGASRAMAQNVHNAVIYLGHQNGTVTLHTPNLPTPPVTILTHMGPVTSISVDASTAGRYMATAGQDGKVKIWDCRNWKGCVREWTPRSQGGGRGGGMVGEQGIEVEWSQKGVLGVASGGSVYMYTPPTIQNEHKGAPPVYMTHNLSGNRPLTGLRFCPYTDVLTIGHSKGLSSILIPGAGEPKFDSSESDPFENRKARQEREVRALLDKIQPDLITLNDEFAGRLATQTSALPDSDDDSPASQKKKAAVVASYSKLSRLDRLKVSGKADVTEEAQSDDDDGSSDDNDGDAAGEGLIERNEGSKGRIEKVKKKDAGKVKQRGKNGSLNRYLRKKRKNVIDPASVSLREKIEAQKAKRRVEKADSAASSVQRSSALDRFRSK